MLGKRVVIHTYETEQRVKTLLRRGMQYRLVIKSLRGLVDKSVINRWACELREEREKREKQG